MKGKGLKFIAESLKENKHLEELFIGGVLTFYLLNNSLLTQTKLLSFPSNNKGSEIRNNEISSISESLEVNQTLQRLDLSRNLALFLHFFFFQFAIKLIFQLNTVSTIQIEGAKRIGEALKVNKSLLHFDLSGILTSFIYFCCLFSQPTPQTAILEVKGSDTLQRLFNRIKHF
jgi:hypothetical protein